MKISLKFIIFFALLFIFLFVFSPCVYASPIFEAIEVDDIDLSDVDIEKIDALRDKLIEISERVSDSTLNEESIQDGEVSSIDVNTVLDFYEEISEVLSNKEIAKLLDKNEDVLASAGINRKLLSASSKLLSNIDTDTVVDIAKNDLDVSTILDSCGNNPSTTALIKATLKCTTTSEKISIVCKLLFSNNFFKILFALFIISAIYSVFVTSYIFKKADEQAFAAVIPIYRDIIHLRLCNFSPWVLLLLFIPFIGWLALMAISVVREI